ncbi:SDR family NAD(P)-dependent oxidoreductase [Mucilaginibacter sp. SP1R1]|uniref:SDR family NAD(P)-dependent oxidoreductase n=1 Tax=Mucilaginibacter sp. SP1R1 TaxID=2723091 RepID=UPI0021032B53|nr:SDR family oxidoreductase [Mucilaginibacter sp. SP1R1]
MMNNSIDLKNKRVVVTGASQGIGAGICHAMATCGADVLVNYLQDQQAAEAVVSDLKNLYGVKAFCFCADVAEQASVVAMFEFADQVLGGIDILVNNAACETIDHAIHLNLDDWDRVFNVDLRGAFICSQEAGKRMVNQNSGVIINISSIHDKVPRKGLIHYCAAKAGLNMMTKCLALELAENNIRVVAVSPGAIETEMNREEIDKFGREKFNSWIPLGRVGIIDDVAWTCAFLASDKAAYYTATEIYIDGGYKESTIPYDPRPNK